MGSLSIPPHFAIFPFLSQGHTIPLLHLSRLLHSRGAAVTIFTTASNSPSIHAALAGTSVSVVELPFPQNIEGLPAGVENTHKLPSPSCFLPFAIATKLMQSSFERALQTLNPPLSCIISDAFLGFTQESARKFGVPRFIFFGMGAFSCTMYQVLGRENPHATTANADEPFSMPGFPNLQLTRNDFEPPFDEVVPSGPHFDFLLEQLVTMPMSQGMIVNSFYELEQRYIDYWNKKIGPRIYCVGPLCMAALAPEPLRAAEKPPHVRFLDERLREGKKVLYIAFGSQADVSPEQLQEIAEGLERSEVEFLWVLKAAKLEILSNFQEKVKGKGIFVTEWVDQVGILSHEGVSGFLSHCGWNSIIESICAGVPILALPFMAEQHLNTRLVAEVLGVGLRLMPSSGTVRGMVAAEEVEGKVRELMRGEGGVEASRRMAECSAAARAAVEHGGSSRRTLDLLVDEVSGEKVAFSSVQSS